MSAALCIVGVAGCEVRQRGAHGTVDREGSTVVSDRGRALAIDAPPRAYRIVYRLEESAGGDRSVSVEEQLVRRPYEARVRTWNRRDRNGPPEQTIVSSFGAYAIARSGGRAVTMTVTPQVGSGDLRLDGALERLLEQDRLEPRERRRVLGRECQVYRTGEPIGTGQLKTGSDDEHADACVDDRGLLLEQVWYLRGRLVRWQIAIEVDDRPAVPAGAFELPSDPLPADQGGGTLRRVDPASRPPFTYWEADPPAGFTHRGRFQVATPVAAATRPGLALGADVDESVVDVYERGPDLVVVAQGLIGTRAREFEPSPATTTVALGVLPDGHLDVGVYGTTLRVRPDRALFLAVSGTIEPEQIVDIARHLRPGARGQLVFLDEPAG